MGFNIFGKEIGAKVVPDEFFSRHEKFSFKDLLAIITVGFFIYFSIKAMNDPAAMELVRVWVTLIAIVLGGYFAQETATAYMNRRDNH